jgi:hypothetical protein
MMVFFATPSSTERTLVAKLMEHSVSPGQPSVKKKEEGKQKRAVCT